MFEIEMVYRMERINRRIKVRDICSEYQWKNRND